MFSQSFKKVLGFILNPIVWLTLLVLWFVLYDKLFLNFPINTVEIWLAVHSLPVLFLFNVLITTARYITPVSLEDKQSDAEDDLKNLKSNLDLSPLFLIVFVLSTSFAIVFIFIIYRHIQSGNPNYGFNLLRNLQK